MSYEIEVVEQKDNLLAKKCATTGLATSLGITVFSGLSRGNVAHLIHPFAAFTVVGFAIWHALLNLREK